MTRPVITVDPAVNWGRPQIRGIPTNAVAGMFASGEGLETVAEDYDLTRHEVLLALWHEAVYGGHPGWRAWSEEAGAVLGGWRGSPDTLEPPDPAAGGTDMVDVVHADGTHEYWSTHCRHGSHDACAATTINGGPRKPAQCKICGAPCRCTDCDHAEERS